MFSYYSANGENFKTVLNWNSSWNANSLNSSNIYKMPAMFSLKVFISRQNYYYHISEKNIKLLNLEFQAYISILGND